MKKLKYNKNTKEIDIINGGKIKNWIKENENFYSALAGFVGLIASIFSLVISIVALKTSREQLEIEKDSIGAEFEYKIECVEDNTEENKQQYLYTIKNTGGRITSATARIRKYIEVVIMHIEGIEIGTIIFRAPIYDGYYTENVGGVFYDEKSKSFYLQETDCDKDLKEDYSVLATEIAVCIDSSGVGYNSGIATYIEISYNNFQDEYNEERYKIYSHKEMVLDPNKNNNNVIYLDEVNKNNIENVAKQAKYELNQILHLEKNEDIEK